MLSLVAFSFALVGCSAEPEPEFADEVLSPEEDPFQKGHLPSAITAEQGETLALGINVSGNLCAKVIGAVPDGNRMLVECKEYRNRKPENFVRYWINGLESGGPLRVRKGFELREEGWVNVFAEAN